MDRIRVLLADNHPVIREGLRDLIEKNQDVEVVGEAGDGCTTVEMALKMNPHVVIMDVSMPGLNGIDATEQILLSRPEIKILGLSHYTCKQYVSNMLKAGASGYLSKNCSFGELGQAIRAMSAGRLYLSPGIADVVEPACCAAPEDSTAAEI